MRKSDIVYTAALVPVDYAALVAAAVTAYFIRYATWVQEIRPVMFNLAFREYFQVSLVVAAGWLIPFAFAGLYAIGRDRKLADEAVKVMLGCSTGALLLILAIFFSRELFSSRFILIAAWGLAIVYVLAGRVLMRAVRRRLWLQGLGLHAVAIVGADQAALTLLNSNLQQLSAGHQVALHVPRGDEAGREALAQYVGAGHEIDELIATDPQMSREEIAKLLDFCIGHQIAFKYSVELTGTDTSSFGVDMIAGVPIIELKLTRLEGWGRIVKRLFDLFISFIGLLILLPLTLIIMIVIWLDDRGPVFVALKRIGMRGKKFRLFKFRSMIVGAHAFKSTLQAYNERADGPLFKMTNDPRVTRVGKVLRRFSIDELPQLWNVFKGDMSLVGPRPHEPEEVAQYKVRERQLLFIRPGITGMAQVSGRSNLSFAEEARIDMFYVQHWSFLLDLIILIKTPLVVLKRTGV